MSSYAQNSSKTAHSIIADSKEYQELKRSGKLGKVIHSGVIIINPDHINNAIPDKRKADNGNNPPAQISSSSCYGYTPPNPGAIAVLANVDDQGFGPISLPFNFCLYGTNYNSCYINSNGNVTFTQAFTTFTATAFPSATIPPMLAPFWGDVDNRGSGTCYYEVLSNAAIFHWVDAGYFNQHTDKLNTFQLIITDFTSPLLQPGNNVGFFYDDMNWTTGDASSGSNGFGGTPATVGVNQGNGVDYIQIGRYDGPGNFYDGPFNQNDSVDWLDNKTFMFDVCNSSNLPPIVAGIDFCDTLRLCVGDTLPIEATFLAPEANQTTWATVDTTNTSGFQIVSNTSGTGSSCQLNAIFIGDTSNTGVNVVNYMAYDNGTPSDTIQFNYIIVVDSISMFPVIMGDTAYCQGNNVVLDGGPGFDSYLWSSGDTTQLTTVTQGSYTLQVFIGGCSVTTAPFNVNEYLNPVVQITGDTIYCSGDSVLLNATQGFDAYLWSTSANDTLDSVYVTQGNYTVIVTDSNGCQGVSGAISINDFSNVVNIIGDTSYCLGDSVFIDAGPGYDSYLWNTGDTTQTIYVVQGNYQVTVSAYGCMAIDSHQVSLINVPIPVIVGDTAYCQGDSVLLDAGTGYDNYTWNTSPVQNSQMIYATQGTHTVTGTIDGCTANSLPFTVIENPLPIPLITGNLHYCSNDSNGTTLFVNNNYDQYSWSTGDTTATIYAMISPPNYMVTVTDSNGCVGISGIVSVTSSAPNNNITGIVPFCPGETITITADPGFTSYFWNTGSVNSSVTVGSGTYIVTVSDVFGCTDIDTAVIVANIVPTADFIIDPVSHGKVNEPVIFTDMSVGNGSNIISWNWNFDFNNYGVANPNFAFTQGPHTVLYNNQGTYSVWLEVTADNNCKDTVVKDYLIVNDIIAPNVFTPNGDGHNDFLVFKNLEYQPMNHLIIFDRWGRNIYETDSYLNNWDGDGHSAGTYFYILTVKGIDPIKGTVTILR